MGVLSKLLLAPIRSPISSTLWVAAQIAEAAEAERNDKGMLMEALKEAERQLLAGELDEDDYDVIETDLLERLQRAK